MSDPITQPGYDFVYLKETVGPTLTEALAALAIKQPDDPVDFIAHYLLKHVANVRRETDLLAYNKAQADYALQKKDAVDKKDSALALTRQQEVDALATTAAFEVDCLTSTQDFPTLVAAVLRRAKTVTNAASAYVGRRLVDTEGVEKVHWFAVTTDDLLPSHIVHQGLSDTPGVTFECFTETVDDSAEADEEGNFPTPAAPAYLHIPNVIKEPRMVFYGVPKLGAYLAKGIKYSARLIDSVTLPTPSEGDDNTASVPSPSQDTWLVLAVESMGQARAFTSAQIKAFTALGEVFGAATTALETRQVASEITLWQSHMPALEAWTETFKSEQVRIDEEVSKLVFPESVSEEKAEVSRTLTRLSVWTSLMERLGSDIQTHLGKRLLPFSPAVLSVIVATLLALNVPLVQLMNPVSHHPDATALYQLLNGSSMSNGGRIDPIQTRVSAFTPTQLVERDAIKTMLEKTTLDDAYAAHPLVGLMFSWTTAALKAAEAEAAVLAADAAPEEE